MVFIYYHHIFIVQAIALYEYWRTPMKYVIFMAAQKTTVIAETFLQHLMSFYIFLQIQKYKIMPQKATESCKLQLFMTFVALYGHKVMLLWL